MNLIETIQKYQERSDELREIWLNEAPPDDVKVCPRCRARINEFDREDHDFWHTISANSFGY